MQGYQHFPNDWTNPFEKYANVKLDHLPQVGVKIKHIFNHHPGFSWEGSHKPPRIFGRGNETTDDRVVTGQPSPPLNLPARQK